jgi:hypothetical protein
VTPEDLDGLRYDVMTALGQLEPLQELVARLTDTRQRGLGFLTPAARAAMDAQHAADRRYRTTQDDRDVVGLDWLNRDADIIPTGHVRAAGTVPAISVEADMYFTLRELVAKTTHWLVAREGVCVVGAIPAEPTVHQLIGRIRTLVLHLTNERRLAHLLREARRLVDDATFVVDGDDRTLLPDPCPHCGRNTLVAYMRSDLIRCDRDARGQYGICRCADPMCECKTRPVAYRHEWHRTDAAAGDRTRTMRALSNLLTVSRAARTDHHEGAPKVNDLTTSVRVPIREEDTDAAQTADKIAAAIKDAAARMTAAGHRIDPGTIKITPEQITTELRHLEITMRAAR